MRRTWRDSSKTTGVEISIAMIFSVVEKARNASSTGDNRARSDERSRKDKYSDGTTTAENRVGTMQLICYGGRQRKKLLCLQRIHIWPDTAKIGGREAEWWKKGDCSMEREEREIMNT